MAARLGAGGDGPEHRRAEGRCLVGGAQLERPAGDVGVDLHDQRALLGQAAAGHDLPDRHAVRLERLDDHPRPERGRLDQRPVDLLGGRGQRGADQQPAELGVDQDGAVAVPPVERQQARFARPEPGGLLLEEAVDVEAARAGLGLVGARDGVLDEPAEVVADAGLAGLVAEEAGDHAVLDVAAHAGHGALLAREDDVAGRGAHDHDHPPGVDDRRGRRGDVGVDVGDGDGRARVGGRSRRPPRPRSRRRAGPCSRCRGSSSRRSRWPGAGPGRRSSSSRGSRRASTTSPCSRRCRRCGSRRRSAARPPSRRPRSAGRPPRRSRAPRRGSAGPSRRTTPTRFARRSDPARAGRWHGPRR